MISYLVSELYEFTPEVVPRASPGQNPLSSVGALNEAELVDLRLSPQRSRAGILLDTRLCPDFPGANTALVVLIGVGKAAWSNDGWSRGRPWRARYGSMEPRMSAPGTTPFPSWAPSGGAGTWALDASGASKQAAAALSDAEGKIDGQTDYILDFGCLSISALSAQIYIGHIDGLDGAIPDMSELSDAGIIAGYPQWSSVMVVREHYVYPV